MVCKRRMLDSPDLQARICGGCYARSHSRRASTAALLLCPISRYCLSLSIMPHAAIRDGGRLACNLTESSDSTREEKCCNKAQWSRDKPSPGQAPRRHMPLAEAVFG